MILDTLDLKEWLALNAKLQQKKNNLRKMLKEKGVLKKAGNNNFDKYTYFSEAQYKQLFTELFSESGLELKFSEDAYETFTGSERQANGRMVRLAFELMDTETGFVELSYITGEAIDKGDKAGYKAYTGALKYYLANTFMVATGDDPEKESPAETMNTKVAKTKPTQAKATPEQVKILVEKYQGENLEKLLKAQAVEKIEDIPAVKASEIIKQLKERGML